jgi:hypothetical protein
MPDIMYEFLLKIMVDNVEFVWEFGRMWGK